MNLKIAFASILAAAIFAPSVGFAQSSVINTSHSQIRHPGIAMLPNDPKSAQACKEAGGTVGTENSKPACLVAMLPNDPKSAQACKEAGGTVGTENNKAVCTLINTSHSNIRRPIK